MYPKLEIQKENENIEIFKDIIKIPRTERHKFIGQKELPNTQWLWHATSKHIIVKFQISMDNE